MLKRLELAKSHSCLNKAQPEEPIFVLRANDPLAAQAVRLWAAMATEIHEPGKIQEALDLAHDMDRWQEQTKAAPVPVVANYPRQPEPPGGVRRDW